MREALSLAANGIGAASPNPRVGCVIIRDGTVIGRGWHHRCGEPHAEVEAVRDAGGEIEGATVYVNLEPCCHYGKTPPCSKMLIEHRAARVVAGMADPNPNVDCGGLKQLREAGIDITVGVVEDECRKINRGFLMRMKYGRPWVTLKTASSLDGNIALADGSSKWITGAESRAKVHMMRAENDAVLTGVGTVIADDPELTVRLAPGRTPLRVVLDHNLRTPLNSRIFSGGGVIFFAGSDVPQEKADKFRSLGASVEIMECSKEAEIEYILKKLCENGVNYLMVEAGAMVTSSFLSSGLADEVSIFAAPKFMGAGLRFSQNMTVPSMDLAVGLKEMNCEKCGGDLWIKGVLGCSPDLLRRSER